jgi:hypothetical protein
MGFRFRKTLGSGFFRFNLSKTGISLSTGPRRGGLTANTPLVSTRKRKSSFTASLPGSGLSYRQSLGDRPSGVTSTSSVFAGLIWVGIIIWVVVWALGHG